MHPCCFIFHFGLLYGLSNFILIQCQSLCNVVILQGLIPVYLKYKMIYCSYIVSLNAYRLTIKLGKSPDTLNSIEVTNR